MAFGVVLGGGAQLAFLFPASGARDFAWRPQWNLRHEGVRHILGLMGPALIGNASGQINVLVNTNFAAGLRDASGHVMNGPVSWLAYAYRFFILPLGIFGIAIASAALPRISRSAAHRNFVEFRQILSRSILMILPLTVPASVGLAILGESMIGIVYQHGKFLASDTRQTALALSCYAVGLAGYAVLKLIAPAFYALGDSRTPMFVSIASMLVNGVAAFTMVRLAGFGHAGSGSDHFGGLDFQLSGPACSCCGRRSAACRQATVDRSGKDRRGRRADGSGLQDSRRRVPSLRSPGRAVPDRRRRDRHSGRIGFVLSGRRRAAQCRNWPETRAELLRKFRRSLKRFVKIRSSHAA